MNILPFNYYRQAHPQVKAFVYHCGINGVFEAIYHGVPVVGLPLFGDQSGNIARLVSRGMGVKLDAPTLTSDQLVEAINTVISDPRLVILLRVISITLKVTCWQCLFLQPACSKLQIKGIV